MSTSTNSGSRDLDSEKQRALRKWRAATPIACALTLLFSILLSGYGYQWWQVFPALVLLDVCLYPTLHYLKNRDPGLPVMPIIGLALAVQYVIPIFTSEAKVEVIYDYVYISDEDVLAALLLTIAGVIALQASYYFARNRRFLVGLPSVTLDLNKRKAEIFCGLVVVVMLSLGRIKGMVSEEFQAQLSAVFGLLQNQALVAIGVLGWIVYSGRGRLWHKLLLYSVVGLAALRGFSSTMLEEILLPVAALLMTKWVFTRRLPTAALVTLGLLVLFFSPVKNSIRTSASEQAEIQVQEDQSTRMANWVGEASDYWVDTIKGDRTLVESTSDAAKRTDLIHQLGYIYSLTPGTVPYQLGSTYSYLVVALVPRLIWPDKPQANYANSFYAVQYGIATSEGVQTTTFGVSLLGEAYMNFGVFGIFLGMSVIGLILGLLERIFAGSAAGIGGRAIFIASVVYLLNGIGSSAEMVFGGILQNLLCSCLLLWWAAEKRSIPRNFLSTSTPTGQQIDYLPQQSDAPSSISFPMHRRIRN